MKMKRMKVCMRLLSLLLLMLMFFTMDGIPVLAEEAAEGMEKWQETKAEIKETEGEIRECIIDKTATKEAILRLDSMTSSGAIASGVYKDITWVIDENWKLTVNGTGEVGKLSTGSNWDFKRIPWYDYYQITSAEINVTGMTDASYLFAWGGTYEDGIDLSGFDTSSVTNMEHMFDGCLMEKLDLSHFDTSNVTNMVRMFANCKRLVELDLSSFNTSNVTNMYEMFYTCESINELDLSNFDTHNVCVMSEMFNQCHNLEKINISNFDTRNVINMSQMFRSTGLINLDLSNFDTSNVTDMSEMFAHCENLKDINVSSFDTSNVINMSEMFLYCESIIEMDLSNFETHNVKSMANLFMWCTNLNSLDLSSFDFNNAYAGGVTFFGACNNLNTIYTPYNVGEAVFLPRGSDDIWYDSDGTVVTELPQNLSYSVALGKNYIPEEKETEVEDANNYTLESVIYSYGNKSIDVLTTAYSIETSHKAFDLTCTPKDSSFVTRYELYSGDTKLDSNRDGIFKDINVSEFISGEDVSVKVCGRKKAVTTQLLLEVKDKNPLIKPTLKLGGKDGLSFDLNDDVPLIGGSEISVNLPDIPVSAVVEDGKIKIGINIKETELYSENSNGEVTVLDGELRETQTANYFSDVYPIDCTVSPANALFCRKNGTLLQAGNLL